MRAAQVCASGTARLVEAAIPEPVEGEVRLRVEGCGVCGSSLPIFSGREWFTYPLEPGAPGHEVWGVTDDGTRVAALSYHGYAEWDVAREEHVVALPPILDAIPFPGEALGCAVNIVRRAGIAAGQRVAVVGMGFIGTTCAALARARGAIVNELHRGEDAPGSFETVIEAAGTQEALDTAARLVAEGGKLVIAGFHQDGLRTIDLQSWNWRGIDVINAHERDPLVVVEGMRQAAELAAAARLDVSALVTHVYPLAALGEAFQAAMERPRGFVKAVVCP
jgi:threonine dehydrogenase-like Zn-dependent dehydrogenase